MRTCRRSIRITGEHFTSNVEIPILYREQCESLKLYKTLMAVYLNWFQFRRWEWCQSGQESPGWGRIALRRSGAPESPPAQGEFPVQVGQRLRNVAEIDVEELVDCQRKVSHVTTTPTPPPPPPVCLLRKKHSSSEVQEHVLLSRDSNQSTPNLHFARWRALHGN